MSKNQNTEKNRIPYGSKYKSLSKKDKQRVDAIGDTRERQDEINRLYYRDNAEVIREQQYERNRLYCEEHGLSRYVPRKWLRFKNPEEKYLESLRMNQRKTQDKKIEKERQRVTALSPAEKAIYHAKRNEEQRLRRIKMSEEVRQYHREYQRQYRKNNKEKVAEINARAKAKRAEKQVIEAAKEKAYIAALERKVAKLEKQVKK